MTAMLSYRQPDEMTPAAQEAFLASGYEIHDAGPKSFGYPSCKRDHSKHEALQTYARIAAALLLIESPKSTIPKGGICRPFSVLRRARGPDPAIAFEAIYEAHPTARSVRDTLKNSSFAEGWSPRRSRLRPVHHSSLIPLKDHFYRSAIPAYLFFRLPRAETGHHRKNPKMVWIMLFPAPYPLRLIRTFAHLKWSRKTSKSDASARLTLYACAMAISARPMAIYWWSEQDNI